MPKLPAYRSNQLTGWVSIPEKQGFGWVLRLTLSNRLSVSVPVRVKTQDRGWTQFFYAELDGLTPWQLDQLEARRILQPAQPHAETVAA